MLARTADGGGQGAVRRRRWDRHARAVGGAGRVFEEVTKVRGGGLARKNAPVERF